MRLSSLGTYCEHDCDFHAVLTGLIILDEARTAIRTMLPVLCICLGLYMIGMCFRKKGCYRTMRAAMIRVTTGLRKGHHPCAFGCKTDDVCAPRRDSFVCNTTRATAPQTATHRAHARARTRTHMHALCVP